MHGEVSIPLPAKTDNCGSAAHRETASILLQAASQRPREEPIEHAQNHFRLGGRISTIQHQGVEFVFGCLLVRIEPMAYTIILYAPFLARFPVPDFLRARSGDLSLSLVTVNGIAEPDLVKESHKKCRNFPCFGDVAQLGEHRLCKPGVDGSSPFVSTN